jgi:hypothetical protein
MKPLACALSLLAAAALTAGRTQSVHAQAGPEPVCISFINKTKQPLVVQGVSFVGGTLRKGQAIGILPGKIGWDINVPPGPRQYRIYDGIQQNKVLLPNLPVAVKDRNLSFIIIPSKTGGIDIIPDPTGP